MKSMLDFFLKEKYYLKNPQYDVWRYNENNFQDTLTILLYIIFVISINIWVLWNLA